MQHIGAWTRGILLRRHQGGRIRRGLCKPSDYTFHYQFLYQSYTDTVLFNYLAAGAGVRALAMQLHGLKFESHTSTQSRTRIAILKSLFSLFVMHRVRDQPNENLHSKLGDQVVYLSKRLKHVKAWLKA